MKITNRITKVLIFFYIVRSVVCTLFINMLILILICLIKLNNILTEKLIVISSIGTYIIISIFGIPTRKPPKGASQPKIYFARTHYVAEFLCDMLLQLL